MGSWHRYSQMCLFYWTSENLFDCQGELCRSLLIIVKVWVEHDISDRSCCGPLEILINELKINETGYRENCVCVVDWEMIYFYLINFAMTGIWNTHSFWNFSSIPFAYEYLFTSELCDYCADCRSCIQSNTSLFGRMIWMRHVEEVICSWKGSHTSWTSRPGNYDISSFIIQNIRSLQVTIDISVEATLHNL